MDKTEETYMILARKSYDEPLKEVGVIKAASREQVRDSALATYPDDDWLEMVALPQVALISVFVEA